MPAGLLAAGLLTTGLGEAGQAMYSTELGTSGAGLERAAHSTYVYVKAGPRRGCARGVASRLRRSLPRYLRVRGARRERGAVYLNMLASGMRRMAEATSN